MATLDTAQPLISFDGSVSYLTPSELYVYDPTDTTEITAVLRSGYSDLGEPSVDKLLNYIDLDYKGQFSILITFESEDGATYSTSSFLLPEHIDRQTTWFRLPLAQRKAFKKMAYWFVEPTEGTIIYGMEIDFSVLRRRRLD